MSKEKHVLNVEERTECGKKNNRRTRRAGKIPAVIYGHGVEARSLVIDDSEWKIVSKHGVNMVTLKQKSNKTQALVKDVQYDYMKDMTVHIDFQEVKMDEIIHASIAVHAMPGSVPVGLSQGGSLEQPIHELEVAALPANLPESIEVDISELEVDGRLCIKDLVLPEGVTATGDGDHVVFHVTAQVTEEEETSATDTDAESKGPEVIAEKDKDEE
jgi:large subunit ribosomal protein L25